MNRLYIKGLGAISPQQSWGEDGVLATVFEHRGDQLRCMEPVYEEWLDPKALRRMSRILRMGITAGKMALRDADIKKPEAIITGTGYGCLEDTGSFLVKMIENNEQALNPTPFIQSTHNTIGSQIALLLNCQGYNQTYSQEAFSFENGLMDAFLQAQEQPEQITLLGGVDEITEISHIIQERFDIFDTVASTRKLFSTGHRALNGEGAVFFVLSGKPGEKDRATVEATLSLYKPDEETLMQGLYQMIHQCNLKLKDIDCVLLGASGDDRYDTIARTLVDSLFSNSTLAGYKHLCGEYPTASSFAMWLAASILYHRHVPESILIRERSRLPKNILIYNPYFDTHHSFILLKSCRAIL